MRLRINARQHLCEEIITASDYKKNSLTAIRYIFTTI